MSCIQICIAALFIITKRWKQSRCPLAGEWINLTMEYNSTLKRNEHCQAMKKHGGNKFILVSERSQYEKATNCIIPII